MTGVQTCALPISLKVFTATTTELAKVEGLGDARAKKIKKVLESQSKHIKESNQKTLHDT